MRGNLLIRFQLLLTLGILCSSFYIHADDYYWIGGSGNWSDINHWSKSSGGTVLHIQIPTSEDNVYFDENSFTEDGQVVTVNTENAICRSLDWSAASFNPVFYSTPDNNIRIFGSLILSPDMTHDFEGTITFKATSGGNTIKTSGLPLRNHIFFDGTGGAWQLADSLTVEGNIYLVNGFFSTGYQTLTCQSFISSPPNVREMDISGSQLFLNNSWILSGTNFLLNATNSIIFVEGNLSNTDGDTLNFHSIEVVGFGSVSSNNVITTGQVVRYNDGGNLQGSFVLDSVYFSQTENNGSISGEAFITRADIFSSYSSITGNHNIQDLYAESNVLFTGNNVVNSATIMGHATIKENNDMGVVYIADTGNISGTNQIADLFLGKTSWISGNNQLESCVFNCDGYINGENSISILTLTAGFRYFLGHGDHLTIDDEFIITGTCERPIYIKSSYNGLKSTINKPNGSVNGEFISLRDIHIEGNGSFTADNSVDLGNNDGWIINMNDPRDLYWVNGNGNWDDPAHWSAASGGTGGECPPTEIDNAFFDDLSLASGDSVIVNVKNAVCNTMDWTSCSVDAIFAGPDTNFQVIYGSLYYSDAMSNQFRGETHFESTEENRLVDASGKNFLNSVRFQGRGGGWSLEDDMVTVDTLFHEHGKLNTNNFNMEAFRFSSADTNLRSLDLNADTVFVTGSSFNPVWHLNAKNNTIDGDSSVIVLTNNGARMKNENHEWLLMNNVHFLGKNAIMDNLAYCVYNLVTFGGDYGTINYESTIDTAIFYGYRGLVNDSDTIKTVIFYQDSSEINGEHIVEIAYYYGDGLMIGGSEVDTALFFAKGYILQSNTIDTTILHGHAYIEGTNSIEKAILRHNGDFRGNNTFGKLHLEYSKVYRFEQGSEQTIQYDFFANGRCTGPIFLISDEQGYEASIRKESGSVTVDYANIRDIKAAGPEIPFVALNSIDLGGNTNWDIYQEEAKALYWVGNSGNWSDSLHWSYESGGEPGYCIPSPVDDVYFDQNSFTEHSTVFINVEIATCHSMFWDGAAFNPSLGDFPESYSLYIYGSLYFIPEMNNDFHGTVYFATPEEDQVIRTAGNSFIGNVVFCGDGGSWHLDDSLRVDKTTRHKRGDLYTGGHPLSTRIFYSNDSTERSLYLGNSNVYIGDPMLFGGWFVNTYNLNIDAGSSHIYSMDKVMSTGNGSDFIRYNDVTFILSDELVNEDVYGLYDDVLFMNSGQVVGNCTIDTLHFTLSGSVSGSDTINYAYFEASGNVTGGQHIINKIIFDGTGNINGENEVISAIFNSNGSVNGSNTIDTTIFYDNGSIQGTNTFNSKVLIYGTGNIVGQNNIIRDLVIHETASIFEENKIYNALLLDWGYLGGTNEFNILTFTPGKTYTLTANTTQIIYDTFNIRGNNCFPITLISSSSNGIQAGIEMETGKVAGDFIVMKDIAAAGGASFYAGGHSDDISNNTGWIWDNAPGYIYGLGEDVQLFCDGEVLELTTDNFNGNPNTVYEWFDGTIGPTYEVTEPGIYGLTVYYSDECAVTGQITAELLPSPEIDLGDDTDICEGETVYLNSQQEYESYLWNTGSTEEEIEIYLSGEYWLEVTNEHACADRDTIMLNVNPAPQVDLGNDMILHNGETVTLDAGYAGGSFEWSTGETTQTIEAQGIEGGLEYSVEVYYKGCYGSDTITIDEYPFCTADIPTAFTPNGDGVNDSIHVYGSGIQTLDLKIFNRFGELVFETDRMNESWDGTWNGKEQPNEVYVYYLKAICFDGIITEKKGNITLIR